MADDRTLDDFFGDDPAGDGDPAPASGRSDGDGAADPAGAEAADVPDGDAEPAAPTYQWTPDGAACAACGATVERRWRDGASYVCGDCKEW